MDTRSKLGLKRRLLRKGQSLLQVSGVSDLLPKTGGATVLMYHSVAGPKQAAHVDPAWHMSPETFGRQMEFLATHRTVVPFNDLIEELREGQRPAPGTVAITFDDGYLDNLEQASPILARYDLPALLYVPTGYVRRAQVQWVDRLYTAMNTATRSVLPDPNGSATRWDLANRDSWLGAYKELSMRLIVADVQARETLLSDIEERLEPTGVAAGLTLDWDGVRRLIADYPRWEIGVHSVDHLDLSACDVVHAGEQLEASMGELQAELGVSARHHSFPFGRSTPATRELASEVGLASAVASSPHSVCDETSDLYCLPRIDPLMTENQLAFWTSGNHRILPGPLGRGPF